MKKKIYPFLIVLAGISWGLSGLFVRYFTTYGLSSLQIAAVRFITSPVIMLLFLLVKDKSLLKIRLKDIWMFLLCGSFSMFFTGVLYFKTITLTSVSIACILMYTAPIFVMITSFFAFGEKLTKTKVLAMILAFFGCIFISGVFKDGAGITAVGFLFGIGAGIAYASYSIFSKFALKKYSPYTVAFYAFLFSALPAFFVVDLRPAVSLMVQNKELIFLYPLSGLIISVEPFLLYTIGLSGMDSGTASVISCTEPLAATVISVFILSEPLSLISGLGMALILTAVIILQRS